MGSGLFECPMQDGSGAWVRFDDGRGRILLTRDEGYEIRPAGCGRARGLGAEATRVWAAKITPGQPSGTCSTATAASRYGTGSGSVPAAQCIQASNVAPR